MVGLDAKLHFYSFFILDFYYILLLCILIHACVYACDDVNRYHLLVVFTDNVLFSELSVVQGNQCSSQSLDNGKVEQCVQIKTVRNYANKPSE